LKQACDLSILIVSWNVADLLAKCLDTIFASDLTFDDKTNSKPSVEIIVVDSASQDHTVALIRERYPKVKLLPQTENVGFTRGNNIALREAQGRYLMLLNPDSEIVGDVLNTTIGYMDAHPDVGVLGPQTLNSDGTTQSTRRRFPTLTIGFFESTWLQPYAPKSLLDHYYVHDQADDSIFDVDWVQGSAMLVRHEVYEQIGGLDEGYVMYSEELDWCKRAKLAGWRVIYFGDAQVVHYGGKSSEQVTARSHIHFQQSKLRYFRKYHGALAANLLRLFLLLNYTLQITLESAKSLLGHKRAVRQERIKVYWQVLRSGLKVT
jgi:GT2 family glycosyltransferase